MDGLVAAGICLYIAFVAIATADLLSGWLKRRHK